MATKTRKHEEDHFFFSCLRVFVVALLTWRFLDIRQRAGYLFLAVMLGHVLLISAQVNSRSGVPVLEAVTFGVVAEVQRGISAGFSAVRRVWSGYVGLRNLKSTNEELTRQLEEAQVALQQQRALADRTRNLEKLLDLRDRSNLKTAAAEIIAAGASPDFRTLTIDKGTSDGIGADMAVIAPAGVVGRVVMPSQTRGEGPAADRSQRRGGSPGRAIARAGRRDRHRAMTRLSMEYVSEVADVIVGDLVVTSGIDGIYPKGYLDRADRIGGEGGRRLQEDYGQARRRLHQPRGSAGRSDADPGPRNGRGERRVKAAGIILAVAAALALQTTLARYIPRQRGPGPGAGRGGLCRADLADRSPGC